MVAIFAIGDLHLSHDCSKPMDLFGEHWSDHSEKIAENWDAVVEDDDLVLVAGDISWAMQLEEALPDLNWVARRKGKKLLVRGNHDYWWSTIGKVRAVLPAGIHALQNDHYNFAQHTICGTRGWLCPGEEGFDNEHDQKIYLREVGRLKLSLKSAVNSGASKIIVVLHFPPFNRQNEDSAFTELLEEYAVSSCVFGHIHDQGRSRIFQGKRGGVTYYFAAADGIGFCPVRIA